MHALKGLARVTLARSPWRAHVACVPRLRQRQSYTRALLSQKQKLVEISRLTLTWLSHVCLRCAARSQVRPVSLPGSSRSQIVASGNELVSTPTPQRPQVSATTLVLCRTIAAHVHARNDLALQLLCNFGEIALSGSCCLRVGCLVNQRSVYTCANRT